jgi:hypothetical protein
MSKFDQIKKINKRLVGLEELLADKTSSQQKLKALSKLIKGFNPQLDEKLKKLIELENKIQDLKKGKLEAIVISQLPVKTEKERKYKKLLLLFFTRKKSLHSEIIRVRKDLTKEYPDLQSQAGTKLVKAARIGRLAKGPLGLITVVATGLVLLQTSAATVTLVNQGCDTIEPTAYSRIKLPGVYLPQSPIVDGGQGEAKIPALKFKLSVDQNQVVRVEAYGVKLDFALQDKGIDLIFNDQSLLQDATELKLKPGSENTLVIRC